MAFVELAWTPVEHDQSISRCHRIGQTADNVTAWYLVANDTLEIDLCGILDAKESVIAKIMDGEEIDEESTLTALIKSMIGGR